MPLRDYDFIGPGILCLGLVLSAIAPAPLQAYSGIADVTLSWGVNGTAISWTSSAPGNSLALPDNLTHFTAESGSNGTIHFNSDFAVASNYGSGTADDCLTLLSGYNTLELRKYGCRQRDSNNNNLPVFNRSPPSDAGPAAAAAGTLNFTDTTLTGTLTVLTTTDEPTGGDESSTGNGASGFNLRTLDTSVYGNVWYGISTGATLTVDLTGDFSPAGWEITGGTVRLSDPGFQCQQGQVGGIAPDYVLCQLAAVPGGFSKNGSHLSFGMDADGGLAGVAMTPVQVRDASGTLVASLSGVLASINVGPGGILSTAFGEYRSGSGINTGGCQSQIRWDGTSITCGTLTAGALAISGTATPVDTEPDPYVFNPVTSVPLNSELTSNTVTISGIAAPARITVAGGSYSIGCTGTFTTTAANIPDGATVCVRHSSATTPGTDTVTTLTIGGITGSFTSTTIPVDTTPDAFGFTDLVDVAASTELVSAPVLISGINSPAPVSVTGGEYSVGCNGLYATTPGSVSPGQSVCARHVSAVAPLTATDTTLTVGGVADTFTSTTAAAPPDTTPDPFSFTDQVDVPLSSVITSQPVVITGLTAAATVDVTSGTYSVGCTAIYTSATGAISDGQTICVRHSSTATNATAVSTILTIGGVSDTFTSTTVPAIPPDTTPDAFTFVDRADVAVSTVITSAPPVTISGINAPTPVSITGGSYTVSVDCTGPFTTAPGIVTNGQEICVRHTSAGANSTPISTRLTVGGVSDTFTSTTVAAIPPDTTPKPFSFVDQSDVPVSTVIPSAPVSISEIDAPAPVSVIGGQYSVGCTATFTTAEGTISNGQTICVRHTSAAANSTSTGTTLTVGGVSDTFTSTTVAAAGGGGGGAVDLSLIVLLAALPALRRRINKRRVVR